MAGSLSLTNDPTAAVTLLDVGALITLEDIGASIALNDAAAEQLTLKDLP